MKLCPTAAHALLSGVAYAMHGGVHAPGGQCVAPGQCTPPKTKFSTVLPVRPRQQWNTAGGFCGALSIQTGGLAFGAWLSQDLIRKANDFGAGHCKEGLGCEILPGNIGETANNLKLDFEEWDYNATKPQNPQHKRWMKMHLAAGHSVVWLVMCKGDDACPYPNACPNGGAFGHVEPVWGLFSDHPLNDTTVYDTDWVVHSSDQDYNPYYRPFHTLEDTTKMEGNCKSAQPGFGKNEMYPCINDQVNYGIAIQGVRGSGSLPTSLAVDSDDEPNTRERFVKPLHMTGTITVGELTAGSSYSLYRYNSTANVPTDGTTAGYSHKTDFVAKGPSYVYEDPVKISSDAAVYYRCFDAPPSE